MVAAGESFSAVADYTLAFGPLKSCTQSCVLNVTCCKSLPCGTNARWEANSSNYVWRVYGVDLRRADSESSNSIAKRLGAAARPAAGSVHS